MEEIWVVSEEERLGCTTLATRRGDGNLSALATKVDKKGIWEATLGEPKDGGLGFVSNGKVRRISGGERERERERESYAFKSVFFFGKDLLWCFLSAIIGLNQNNHYCMLSSAIIDPLIFFLNISESTYCGAF